MDYEHEQTPSLIDDLATNSCIETKTNYNSEYLAAKPEPSPSEPSPPTNATSEIETISNISIPSELKNYLVPAPMTDIHKLPIIDEDDFIGIDDDIDNVRQMERYLEEALNLNRIGKTTEKHNKLNITQALTTPQYVTISIHNVRGFTEEYLQRLLLDYIYPDFTIFGLSETKLTMTNDCFVITKLDLYVAYWASSECLYNGSGVGILVKKPWDKHINNITRMDDRIIAITLSFKHRSSLMIVQVYLSSDTILS